MKKRYWKFISNDHVSYTEMRCKIFRNGDLTTKPTAVIVPKNVFFYKFRFVFYMGKYKSRFIAWLWRAREQIVIREWHPDRMRQKIKEVGGDLEALF